MDKLEPTSLLFHHDGDLVEHKTSISDCLPVSNLPEADQQLFKDPPEDVYAIITSETIFHPQGGGQPSDTGRITTDAGAFEVQTARTSASNSRLVLHFGKFSSPEVIASFSPGSSCTQAIDADKRLLYSRYHTAGHVLGAAVRHLLQQEIPGFDELKASHFPDSAACEFAGAIAGSHKQAIQDKVDAYVAAAMPVEIDYWSEEDFHREGLARLIPAPEVREAMGVRPGEKFRVVKIVGAEVYPCGGTHVHTTDRCGKTVVRKIARSKGQSRISYNLPDA